MKDNLFRDFSPLTNQEWIRQIKQDLKGKDFEKAVVTKKLEGLTVQPFYTSEDRHSTEWLKAYQNQLNPKPEIPGIARRNWANVAVVRAENEKVANKEILEVLQSGADGLLLELNGRENYDELLEGVLPEYINIFLKTDENPVGVVESFFGWVGRNAFEKEKIQGGLLWDGFVEVLENQAERSDIVKAAGNLLDAAKTFPHFRVLGIDAAFYHNSGAHAVQELALALGAFVELMDGLTENGRSPEEIFGKVIVNTAAGSDYFLEIAKLRVLRILVHQLAKLYQVSLSTANLFIFCSTSYWTKTARDVPSNMIRNTTEAMAGILGGCNALLVLPHDVALETENGFSKRMALNTASIIKEECYFDKVLDPVAGTYYLGHLIDSLFDLVQKKLEDLESAGGWWNLYQGGLIQKEIKETQEERMQAIVDGQTTKIGINRFVNSKEEIPELTQTERKEIKSKKTYRHSFGAEQKKVNRA